MLSKYIAIFLWTFLIGVVLAHSFVIPVNIIFCGIAVGLMALVWVSLNHDRSFARVSVIALGLCLGVMVWVNNQQTSEYISYTGQLVDTEGVIVGWPNITASGNQAIIVKPDGFSQALRASLRLPKNFYPNDRVWIRGVIKQPENFSEFNYVSYLQKNNVYAELDKPKLIIIESVRQNQNRSQQNRVLVNYKTGGLFLSSFRQWVIRTASERLNQSSSGLVLGMLIGYGDSVPKNLAEAFKKTGLTHILVASGFNLTIIASSIGFLAWVLGRRWSDLSSIGIVWLFVVLTGSSGSVVRAGIMTSVILVARALGRMPTSYFSLLFAVAVMIAINPLQLFYDIGFQLSVAATLGVLEANKLRVYLQKEGWLIELLWPTCGATVFTAPIISFYFETFSVIAPLANLFVLPAVPIVMILGALSLLPVVYVFTVPVTELIVKVQEQITLFFASWKYSSISLKSTLVFAVGYYLILFLVREILYLKILRQSDKLTKIII